jgi:hypothetical protein
MSLTRVLSVKNIEEYTNKEMTRNISAVTWLRYLCPFIFNKKQLAVLNGEITEQLARKIKFQKSIGRKDESCF